MASPTITRGYSIAGGMQTPAWRTITAGYSIGTAIDLASGSIGFTCPARRLDVLSASGRLDFNTPSNPLDVERPGD